MHYLINAGVILWESASDAVWLSMNSWNTRKTVKQIFAYFITEHRAKLSNFFQDSFLQGAGTKPF